MKKTKPRKVNGIKQEFEIVSFNKDFTEMKVNNEQGKILDAICIDISSIKRIDISQIKRGVRMTAIASKRLLKSYGGKLVITNIMSFAEPVQMDIEDMLQGG